MAQDLSQPKRKPRENQYIFDLGVRGRKTGLTVEDTGIRDENGLEPMDHLFSSPEKSTKKVSGKGRSANATISSEEEMDIVESTLPDADATGRPTKAGLRLPLPHSRSPKKTFLRSPARRNPSLGPLSSPSRGSIMVPRGPTESISVRRKLDFSNENIDASTADKRVIGRSPQKQSGFKDDRSREREKLQAQPVRRAVSEEDEQEDAQDQYYDNEGDSYQIMDGGDVDLDNPIPESDPKPEPPAKPKGKGKAKEPSATKPQGKRGRPKRKSDATEENDDSEPPTKKIRRSLEGPKAAPNGKSKNAAAAAKPKPKPAAAAAAGKGRPKTTNLATISENESPAVQRGPPMPRNNRGLVILRRETPMDSNGFKQTRSGRNSVRPLAYWKNERIEYSEDENVYYNGGNFLLPKIKGVIRADEVEESRPRRSHRSSKSKSKKRAATVESEEEDDDDTEPWETEPGRLVGEIREWDPEDPTGMHAEEVEEEIAISSSAIETRPIAGASFRFAKTLTMPFFGSGVVDLPPGSEKKPKNSRKMQMAFFVFYGRVEVTVNDSTFRIGKGGMWQVPRGNFYSIVNDSDKPARIFFSQGCEVLEEATEINE